MKAGDRARLSDVKQEGSMRHLMMRRTTVVGCGVAVLALGGAGAAIAASGSIVADSGKVSRAEAAKLARTFALRTVAPSAAFAARPPYGRVAATSTKRLAGFPRSGKSYMILSNGHATSADDKNSSGSKSQNAGGPSIRGARDVTIFRVNLKVPKNANCLSFRFRFLTEEFPEFVKKEFNDAFIAELDETTWSTNTLGSPKIDAPRNFATGPQGKLISVNGVGDTSVSKAQAKGTTYDGATRVLRASSRIKPGNHRLYLSIFDQGDRQYDSSVFIDKLTLTNSASCNTGVIVD